MVYIVFIVGRGGERVHLDFFSFIFLTVEGEGGGWRLMFLFSLHWKCGRRREERVNLRALEMFFSLWRG
jgi:hypothetical protein